MRSLLPVGKAGIDRNRGTVLDVDMAEAVRFELTSLLKSLLPLDIKHLS
jgi:hypothetical protein